VLWFLITGGIIILLLLVLLFSALIWPPAEEKTALRNMQVQQSSENSWRLGKNWFRKNRSGLWELYVEGRPYERGIAVGKLTSALIYRQEEIFVQEIRKIVPSRLYLLLLKLIVAIMNKRLPAHIGKEYCSAIHGISHSAPAKFDFIGPRYQRYLNYHAAHDIGHILLNMNLVGCTAFAAWGNRTGDGGMIMGRNFDFHIGDAFSQEKIVCFMKPDKGYRFASITWGGMTGTISGMNEKGLAVTVNASKSEFPNRSATPVSIVVREILQYASNIEETLAIASAKKIFVSESFCIASAADKRAVIIEKSNRQTALFEPRQDSMICTNHFQSPQLLHDRLNKKYMEESPTTQRFARVQELMDRHEKLGLDQTAGILRDKLGLNDAGIGWGNEQAVDQLLAHHSVIFMPEKLLLWISAGPYPEGAYQAYDLNKIFSLSGNADETREICSTEDTIAADPFLNSPLHENFRNYKRLIELFTDKNNKNRDLTEYVDAFIASNPEKFSVYAALGDYFLRRKEYEKAAGFFIRGLSKTIPNKHEKDHMITGRETAMKKAGML
jgi:isopenicillin-N N-acyltransferase like protein